MRKLTLLIAILIATLAAPLARADEAPDSIDQFNARLDRAAPRWTKCRRRWNSPSSPTPRLRNLRARIEPLPHELDETIEKLTPRLAAIEARLKELAPAAAKPRSRRRKLPKPAEKPQEPKPSPKPAVKSGVDERRRRREVPRSPRLRPRRAKRSRPTRPRASAPTPSSKTSVAFTTRSTRRLKRARAMLLETRQVVVTIVARQRGLFAKNLFLRTAGSVLACLVARRARRRADRRSAHSANFLSDRTSNVVDRVNNGRAHAVFRRSFSDRGGRRLGALHGAPRRAACRAQRDSDAFAQGGGRRMDSARRGGRARRRDRAR